MIDKNKFIDNASSADVYKPIEPSGDAKIDLENLEETSIDDWFAQFQDPEPDNTIESNKESPHNAD